MIRRATLLAVAVYGGTLTQRPGTVGQLLDYISNVCKLSQRNKKCDATFQHHTDLVH